MTPKSNRCAALVFAVILPATAAHGQLNPGEWVQVNTPNPSPGFNFLVGADALAADDIWAVGRAQNINAAVGASFTMTMHYDGQQWTIVPSPNSGVYGNWLMSVDAIATDDVWAVGQSNEVAGEVLFETLTIHFDGQDWTVVPSPNPNANNNVLNAVDAVSANDVWAVGSVGFWSNLADPAQPLAMHFDGTSWQTILTPTFTATTDNILTGVAAVAADDVWAVGWTGWPGEFQTLIMHFNGEAWSVVPSPQPNENPRLVDIVAISADDIWAVGWMRAPMQGDLPLMLHFDGTAWSFVESPSHPIGTSLLLGVGAGGPDLVWAVGYNDRGGPSFPFSIRYDGTDLAYFDPELIGIGTIMREVTVAPNGDAWAIGSYFPYGSNHRTLVMSWAAPAIEGDLDGDGTVGILDFLALLAAWGPCPAACPPACPADLDRDCSVGILDFLTLLANWS
jgi:hypothetical protein